MSSVKYLLTCQEIVTLLIYELYGMIKGRLMYMACEYWEDEGRVFRVRCC